MKKTIFAITIAVTLICGMFSTVNAAETELYTDQGEEYTQSVIAVDTEEGTESECEYSVTEEPEKIRKKILWKDCLLYLKALDQRGNLKHQVNCHQKMK